MDKKQFGQVLTKEQCVGYLETAETIETQDLGPVSVSLMQQGTSCFLLIDSSGQDCWKFELL